jgi:hypothetical protein
LAVAEVDLEELLEQQQRAQVGAQYSAAVLLLLLVQVVVVVRLVVHLVVLPSQCLDNKQQACLAHLLAVAAEAVHRQLEALGQVLLVELLAIQLLVSDLLLELRLVSLQHHHMVRQVALARLLQRALLEYLRHRHHHHQQHRPYLAANLSQRSPLAVLLVLLHLPPHRLVHLEVQHRRRWVRKFNRHTKQRPLQSTLQRRQRGKGMRLKKGRYLRMPRHLYIVDNTGGDMFNV